MSLKIENTIFLGFLCLFLPAAFYGCSSGLIKIDERGLARLKKEPEIHAVTYIPASFIVETPGAYGSTEAMFGEMEGPLGGFAHLREFEENGKKMIRDYSLEDPVLKVRDKFISSVGADLGLQEAGAFTEPLKDDSIEGLKRRFGKGMVFDFKTTRWLLNYYPADLSHYRMTYGGRARLVSLEDSRVLWQGACRFSTTKEMRASPTMEDLVADDGALLKTKLLEASDRCASELLRQFLGEKSGNP